MLSQLFCNSEIEIVLPTPTSATLSLRERSNNKTYYFVPRTSKFVPPTSTSRTSVSVRGLSIILINYQLLLLTSYLVLLTSYFNTRTSNFVLLLQASSPWHFSSGRAPQKLHVSPVSLISGLLLAQVPANLPSFFAQILIAIPAKANANNTIETSAIFISLWFEYKVSEVEIKSR